MHWLFFVYVRTDHDGGKKFLRRGMQKILWGSDEAKTTRILSSICITIYSDLLNKHILSEILKKGRC